MSGPGRWCRPAKPVPGSLPSCPSHRTRQPPGDPWSTSIFYFFLHSLDFLKIPMWPDLGWIIFRPLKEKLRILIMYRRCRYRYIICMSPSWVSKFCYVISAHQSLSQKTVPAWIRHLWSWTFKLGTGTVRYQALVFCAFQLFIIIHIFRHKFWPLDHHLYEELHKYRIRERCKILWTWHIAAYFKDRIVQN